MKSEREESKNQLSAAVISSSSSSSSFNFTVGCPRLAFQTRYTSRTRKPRRVRLPSSRAKHDPSQMAILRWRTKQGKKRVVEFRVSQAHGVVSPFFHRWEAISAADREFIFFFFLTRY